MSSGGLGSRRCVLAIELSQRAGSVAMRTAPGAPVLRRDVEPATHERDGLMVAVDALAREAHVEPAQIGLVTVSIGPGGFTGLRVAVATAKALWLATGAQLVAVPSALVVAHTLLQSGRLPSSDAAPLMLGVALASKGSTAWLERLQVAQGKITRVDAALYDAPDAPLVGLAALIADEHLPAAWVRAGIPLLPAAWCAASCLVLGEELLAAAGPADPHTLAPMYPRPPEAVRLWEHRREGQA